MSGQPPREVEAASGPGPMLRRAREERGLTEQAAAEQLNFDVSVVIALEREDYASLGAPVFAKGHLRRYGGMLGIGEQQLLDAYERAQTQPETPSLIPRSRLEMMPVRSRPKWPAVLGGALAFIIAAGIAAYVSEYGLRLPSGSDGDASAAPQASAALPEDAATEAVPADAPAVAPGAGAPVASDAAQSAAPVATRPVPPGHVSISIAFSADSWAEIYDGSGKAVLYDLGRAGTQRSIAAAAPLSVTFGNAPGVVLHVNGRPAVMPPVAAGGTVARFKVEADGSLR